MLNVMGLLFYRINEAFFHGKEPPGKTKMLIWLAAALLCFWFFTECVHEITVAGVLIGLASALALTWVLTYVLLFAYMPAKKHAKRAGGRIYPATTDVPTYSCSEIDKETVLLFWPKPTEKKRGTLDLGDDRLAFRDADKRDIFTIAYSTITECSMDTADRTSVLFADEVALPSWGVLLSYLKITYRHGTAERTLYFRYEKAGYTYARYLCAMINRKMAHVPAGSTQRQNTL